VEKGIRIVSKLYANDQKAMSRLEAGEKVWVTVGYGVKVTLKADNVAYPLFKYAAVKIRGGWREMASVPKPSVWSSRKI
jgi:hypothetical protein